MPWRSSISILSMPRVVPDKIDVELVVHGPPSSCSRKTRLDPEMTKRFDQIEKGAEERVQVSMKFLRKTLDHWQRDSSLRCIRSRSSGSQTSA